MATNVWTITQGETGAVRTGTLSDADGPVDLSQYDSVNVIVARSATATPVINAAVTIDPDQVTNKGDFSYTFTAPDAAIAPRTYLLSFKAMDGANPVYYPLNRRSDQTYGKLVVVDPLA